MGKPVAFDASAEERDTRGFISTTTISPFFGLTANWTLEPPVSTPISRRMAMEAFRICWYSTSVSVWAGATVMESPVWTPMASKFSMEQMMTTLSARSRITSSSILLPAEDGLLEHDLADHAGVEALLGDVEQVLAVVGHTAARSSEGEGGAYDDGEPDLVGHFGDVAHVTGEAAAGHPQADFIHGVAELFPVLGLVDDLEGGADELHAVFFQHAELCDTDGRVEARLAPEGGEDGVGPLPFDDLGNRLRGDGLDIGPVGRLGVRHDRGGIRVDEDDFVALLPEGLARLGARVVELAGLADDDGPRADDEDLFQVRTLRHRCASLSA